MNLYRKINKVMFLQNKYSKYYFNIIDSAKSRVLSSDTYTERHHILPKSLGGNDSSANIIKLTAREHFICHWLLTKIVSPDKKVKMVFALHRMKSINKRQQRYSTPITSRVFERNRIEHSKFIGAINKGKKLSKETKQKISISLKGKNLGKSCPEHQKQRLRELNTGKKCAPFSQEHKEKLSMAAKQRIRKPYTEEQKQKMSESISEWWKSRKS
jgi:hypothetical protein